MDSGGGLASPMSSVAISHGTVPEPLTDPKVTVAVTDPEPSFVKWTKVDDAPGSQSIQPLPRHGHRAVAFGNCMILFGGGHGHLGIMKDLYVFDISSNKWFQPEIKGEAPSGSAAFGLVLDGSRMLLYGGMVDFGRYSSDLYELDFSNWEWKKLSPLPPRNGPPPCARFGHTFTIFSDHRLGPLVFLFGGLTNDNDDSYQILPRHLNDLYTLQVKQNDGNGAWNIPSMYGTPPTPRESHTAVAYVSKDGRFNKLIVYGGMSGCRLGDLHVLDVDTMMWCKPEIRGPVPPPRSLHTASLVGEKMYVFGGWVPMFAEEIQSTGRIWKCSDSLVCLNVETFTWEKIQNNGSGLDDEVPLARAGHSAVVINNKIYIWSGRDGHQSSGSLQPYLKDFWKVEVQKPKGVSKVKLLKGGTNFLEIGWSPVPGADSYIIQCLAYENEKPTKPQPPQSNPVSSAQPIPPSNGNVRRASTPTSTKFTAPEPAPASSVKLSSAKEEAFAAKDLKQKMVTPHPKTVRFVEKPTTERAITTIGTVQNSNVSKWVFANNSSGIGTNIAIKRPNITTSQILSLVGHGQAASSSSSSQQTYFITKPIITMANRSQISPLQSEVTQPPTFHGIQGMASNKPGIISIPSSTAGSAGGGQPRGLKMFMMPPESASSATGLTQSIKIITPTKK